MNKSLPFIHTGFSLCGVTFDGDISSFARRVTALFSPCDEIYGYASAVCTFVEKWMDGTPDVTCHTSGSTGTPKDIHLSKECMMNSARATGDFFHLSCGSSALLCLPVEYIAARMMLVRAMTLGWDMDIMTPSSHVLSKCSKVYDFTALVPMQLYKCKEHLDKCRIILVGGGTVNDSFIEELKVTTPATGIYQSYGMTETASHVAIRELYPHVQDTYTAMRDVSFSTDEDNRLIINAFSLHPHPLYTNDVVHLVDDTHFFWKGRYDFVINSGGVKIHPEESEKILSACIFSRFFVYGVPDETLGERQVLMVEGDGSEKEKIEEFLDGNFDRIHRPKEIRFIREFVLTSSGKINRRETVLKAGIE